MGGSVTALVPERVFDGEGWHAGAALRVAGGRVEEIGPARAGDRVEALDGWLVPGFVDLQVNGGGGALLNNDCSPEGLARICAAHAKGGTTALLATLITDRPEATPAAIAAVEAARAAGQPGLLGLHLEGPHLSVARKGTHDPALIRPMTGADLAVVSGAAGRVGHLLVTLAPESVSLEQVRALVAAGAVVSLGHTDADAATARDYVEAGARLVTHLFNAMSQMGHRAPGLVGLALDDARLASGLIADGFHVDPTVMGVALRAARGRVFLVTDAMCTIGTDLPGFTLNGREVYRRGGRLTLADGTLAGADVDMIESLRFVVGRLGVPLEEALRMASLYPAEAVGALTRGRLGSGSEADAVLLSPGLEVAGTWIGGRRVVG